MDSSGRVRSYQYSKVYQYERLQDGHIRLLKLRTGMRSDEPQIVEIISCLLKESPEYEALSYVWDKPLVSRSMAYGKDRRIRVPCNVFNALQWLQQETSERLLWIDAVCINQKKKPDEEQREPTQEEKEATKEREAQVRIMGKIYTKAKRVFMYFGSHSFSYNARQVRRAIKWIQSERAPIDETPAINYMRILRDEEYFKRIWTIQEVILAKEVFILFENDLLSWSQLLSKISKLPQENYHFERLPVVAVQRLLDNDDSPGLLGLLRATATSEATDKRDKIYALLGLIKGGLENYPVRYGPWTVAKVFAHYTFRFCQESNSLDLLETSRHIATTSIEQLPSWAIDFTLSPVQRFQDAIARGIYSNSNDWIKTGFSAHNRLPLSLKISSDQDPALDCQGRKVGDIVFTSPCALLSNGRAETVCFSDHLEHLTDTERPFAEWDSLMDFLFAFVCTRACGSEGTVVMAESWVKSFELKDGEDFKSLKARLVEHFAAPKAAYRSMFEDIRECCKGNSFFATKNPFIGLGARHARPEDTVCILKGGRTPFILRKTNTDKNEYQIVGECYVHGIMQGEWMRDVNEDDLEWFRLV